MADIAAIREAIRSRLATLLAAGGQSSAYMLDNPTPPTLQVVGLDATEYDTAFGRGGDHLTMVVQGLAGRVSDVGSQIMLDEWLDTSGLSSVKAAIEAGRPAPITLDGTVAWCRVASSTGHRVFILDGAQVVGCEWTLEIGT